MTSWLLLKREQAGRGEAVPIKGLEATSNLPESDVNRLVVARAVFNGDSSGDAAKSIARGGGVALRLLARQYRNVWAAAPLRKLTVETLTPLSGTYDGDSGDLLFALATFLSLAQASGLISAPPRDFAATGTLDSVGVVGPVKAVVLKIEAALQALPSGSIIFYPRHKPEGETHWVDEALLVRARDCGIELQAVEFIEEALAALGIELERGYPPHQSPYRALDTYQVEHSPIFFGRDDQVTEFLERLQRAAEAKRPGGLVEAASGAGKSSFVQAGLLARLRILPRKDHTPVEYAVWQPRLAGAGQEAEIDEAALAKSVLLNWKTHASKNSTGFSGLNDLDDIQTLADLSTRLGRTALDERLLVWVVDQFEELFTQKYTDAARVAFGQFLAQLQAMGVWVIATLRTEFKPRFMSLADEQGKPLLVDVFKHLMFPLARMPVEALGQMISEPAKVAGVSFETRADGVRLDALLRQEALGADSMPLVGYALNELWLQKKLPDEPDEFGRRTPQLTFEAYEAICGGEKRGGIRRVLGIEAERAFGQLPQEAQDELPQLLDALAVPVDGEENEAARPADLAQWPEGTPGWQLIEALREKRLLITEPATENSSAQVRVVHEAIFEGWDTAREILKGSRDTRTQVNRLEAKHNEWSNHGEPPDELLTSAADLELAEKTRPKLVGRADLAQVLIFVDLSLAKRDKLQRQDEEDRQKDKRRVRVFALLIVFLLAAVVAAGYQNFKAEENLAEAKRQAKIAENQANRALSAEATAEEKRRDAEEARGKAKDAEGKALASLAELRIKTDALLHSQQETTETLALARQNIDDVLTVLEQPEMDDVHGFGAVEQELLRKLVPLERRLSEKLGADQSQAGLVRSVRLEMRNIAQLRSTGDQLAAFKASQQLRERLAKMPESQRLPELIEARFELMYRILSAAYLVETFDSNSVVVEAQALISRTQTLPGLRYWRESLAAPISKQLRIQGRSAEAAAAALESARSELSRQLEGQPNDRFALASLMVTHDELARLHKNEGRVEEAKRHEGEYHRVIKLGRERFPRSMNFAQYRLHEIFDSLDAALNAKSTVEHQTLVAEARSVIERFRGDSSATVFEAAEAQLLRYQATIAHYVELDSAKALDLSRASLQAYGILYGQSAKELPRFANASLSLSNLVSVFETAEQGLTPLERGDLRTRNGRELIALSEPFVACARQMGPGADCSNLVVLATDWAVERLKSRAPVDVARVLQQREPLLRAAAERMLLQDRRYAEGAPHDSRPSTEPLNRWCSAMRDLGAAQAFVGTDAQKVAARDDLVSAGRDCAVWATLYDWDFYLRSSAGGLLARLANLQQALGQPDEARKTLKRCWDAGLMACQDQYLTMLKSGQGGKANPTLIAEVEKVKANMKRFTVPVRAKDAPSDGLTYPFHVYIMEESQLRRHKGIEDQAIWLLRNRGLVIPQDVRDAFLKLETIARDNKLSFPDLAVYALGAAQPESIDDKEVATIQAELSGASFKPGVEVAGDAAGVALAGADVVEVFDNGKEAAGSYRYRHLYGGAIWLFKDAANRDRFSKEPAKFVPELGGHCVERVAAGSKVPGLSAFSVRFEGRLYLACSEHARKETLKDLPGTVVRAQEQWVKLRSMRGTRTQLTTLGMRLQGTQ